VLCPRCSVAEVSAITHQCPLCGFVPSVNVLVEQPVPDQAREVVQEALTDRYQITAVLRLGQRSFVYLARDLTGERLVALKVIPVPQLVDPTLAGRFERQAGMAARLRHAHVVPVYAFGETRTFLWYAMQHVRGRALAEHLRETGPMDLESCLRLVEQIASALDFAHRSGVVHGNLKPSNILVDADGWVRVTDFAILDAFGRRHPAAPDAPVMHATEYLAPEQFYARTVGAAADQYALGVIVFQCLAGAVPFVGDSFEELARRHANEEPPRLSTVRPDLPVPTMDAVQRALAKTPGGRFPTVLDFASALSGGSRAASVPSAPLVTPSAAAATPVLVVDDAARWITRGRMLLAAGLLAGIGMAGAVILRPSWLESIRGRAASVAGSMAERLGQRGGAEPAPQWETFEPAPERQQSPPEGPRAPAATRSATTAQPTPEPAGPQPVRAQPAQPARLFVQSRPWGVVYLDGVEIGNTPQADLSVPPGRHTVRIQRDGFVPFEQAVDLAAGQTVRLTGIVLEARNQ
jgi:hypothetical protein